MKTEDIDMDLINLQIMMFILMGVGILLRKKNIIDNAGKKTITDLVIMVFLPCSIVNAFSIEFSIDILKSAITIFIISILIQLGCTLISRTCYKKISKEQRIVLQYGTVCSNAGFLGNPVAEGVYGSMGLLYASFYLVPQRIVMWSAGLSYFTQSPNKKTVIKKIIMHPCIIATMIGLFLMISQISLPVFLSSTNAIIGGCTTAISMILIGTILADADLKTMISKTTLIFSLIRLIIIPALVFIPCLLLRIDPLIMGVAVVLAAMPAGSTTAILAEKYDGDAEFASKCVVLTTILSMLVVPIWCTIVKVVS